MADYLRLVRIKHWIKNLLIFCPLFFGKQLFDFSLLIRNLLGFFLFSLIASSIYIINDINDINADRNHPIKCRRPLAAGKISIKNAWCLFGLICILSMGILISFYFIISNWYSTAGCLIAYFAINIFYSNGGKNIPLLDIILLSSGFLLRVIYGAVLSEITISNWLYLVVISFSCYMALGKRRNELRNQGTDSNSRRVLRDYSADFLNQNMYMCMTLAIVFYSLWCTDIDSHTSFYLIATVPVILFLAMKYNYVIENMQSDGDPVEVILADKILWGLILGYIIYVFAVLY